MNDKKSYTDKDERIARYAKALGHPARVAVLRFLASRNDCFFGDIREYYPLPKQLFPQHLAELKSAGLIQGEIEPPKVRYCINRQAWNEVSAMFGELFGELKEGRTSCCSKWKS